MKRWLVMVLLTAALLAACTPAATPTPAPAVLPLNADSVGDAQVSLTTLTGDVAISYQLKDGVFQKGTDPAGASYAVIRLMETMAFGDLNGDGLGDAAALIAENYGGTGVFVSLAAFVNEGGAPVQAAILGVDDRPIIQSVDIQNGLIGLEAVIHGLQDPMCCPTLASRRHYRLVVSELVLMDYSTQVVSGQWRTIEIATPEPLDLSGGMVELTGRVSIAPFENNLSWHLVDAAGNELAAGPVPVTAMDMGAPGTFRVEVPLDHAPVEGFAWIQIRDLSAADGSLLAMDSVQLR